MNPIHPYILKELYYESPQSIASLSNRIGKSVPLVAKGVQELLAKEFIEDKGLAQSNGGRRANLFALNNLNLPYILLVAVDQHQITLSLYDFSNTEIKESKKIESSLNADTFIMEELISAIDSYLGDTAMQKIIAISISMPGFVNTALGLNTSYGIADKRCQIRNILETQYQKPTFIENDSTVIAIAEHKFGNAKDIKDVLVINLNWGVGLGMIINNKLFKGSRGFAGEFSHIPLSNLNKICSCGKRGCLEVEASLEAVISHALERMQQGDTSKLSSKINANNSIDINDILYAAKHGDQLAIESFGKIGAALGKGIATLIHIINPEKIIISGFGAKIGEIIMPKVQSALLEYSIQRLSENTKIEISTLENSQLIGTMATAVANLDWKTTLQTTNTNKL